MYTNLYILKYQEIPCHIGSGVLQAFQKSVTTVAFTKFARSFAGEKLGDQRSPGGGFARRAHMESQERTAMHPSLYRVQTCANVCKGVKQNADS